MESKKKKKDTKELIYKTEIESQTWKTNLWLSKEMVLVWGGDIKKLGVWD